MRTLLISLTAIIGLLAPLTALAATGGVTDPNVLRQLAAVREATTKYHDVKQAEADGYIPVSECVQVPGLGTMGIHYLNPGLASDLDMDPLAPELLLYVPSRDGLRLVAVEYFVANVGQPEPSLFGHALDGPMAGHAPGMPKHYDLHVWVWQANPNGIFAQWNPTVRCG